MSNVLCKFRAIEWSNFTKCWSTIDKEKLEHLFLLPISDDENLPPYCKIGPLESSNLISEIEHDGNAKGKFEYLLNFPTETDKHWRRE
jgi:hypothetical protein